MYEESRGEQVWESLVAPGAGGWGTVVEDGGKDTCRREIRDVDGC